MSSHRRRPGVIIRVSVLMKMSFVPQTSYRPCPRGHKNLYKNNVSIRLAGYWLLSIIIHISEDDVDSSGQESLKSLEGIADIAERNQLSAKQNKKNKGLITGGLIKRVCATGLFSCFNYTNTRHNLTRCYDNTQKICIRNNLSKLRSPSPGQPLSSPWHCNATGGLSIVPASQLANS